MRKLHEIAEDIERDWEHPYFGAVPYIEAMRTLSTIHDYYGADPADSIVMYFLANANTWRGDVAREIKKELKALLKGA